MSVHQVPTKIVFVGPKHVALRALGYARQLMGVVENLMSFQGLSQYSLTREAPNGCIVECWSGFGLRCITITAKEDGDAKKKYKQKCFCTSCIALGYITDVKDLTFLAGTPCYDFVDPLPLKSKFYCADVLYSVSVCSGQFYTLFENIKAIDNMPYCKGNKVFVIPIASSEDTELLIDTRCHQTCGRACFAAPSSPIINVGILQVNASHMPKMFSVPDGN